MVLTKFSKALKRNLTLFLWKSRMLMLQSSSIKVYFSIRFINNMYISTMSLDQFSILLSMTMKWLLKSDNIFKWTMIKCFGTMASLLKKIGIILAKWIYFPNWVNLQKLWYPFLFAKLKLKDSFHSIGIVWTRDKGGWIWRRKVQGQSCITTGPPIENWCLKQKSTFIDFKKLHYLNLINPFT